MHTTHEGLHQGRAMRAVGILAAAGIALSGCSLNTGEVASTQTPSASPSTSATAEASEEATKESVEAFELAVSEASVEAVMAQNQSNHAQADDVEYEEDGATTIQLSGTSATVKGSGAEAGEGSVRITEKGTYILSGSYTGTIEVAGPEKGKVRLVLDGVDIEADGAAINATEGDELVIILAAGSTNTLTDTQASEHAEAAAQAEAAGVEDDGIASGTIASKIDTTIGGEGAATIIGGKHAISTSDGLAIYSGTWDITSYDDGVRGKDYIWMEGGDFTVACAGDAFQATNDEKGERGYFYMTGGTITVSEAYKGIDAITDIVITGGTLDVTSSNDTVEAAYILLAGGSGTITSGDDPVNAVLVGANPWIAVSGGDWVFNGQGDGFDSNGAARISGGSVTVFGPTNGGNGAIDSETGLEMAGGTLFAIGSMGMDEGPSLSSPQASVKFTGNFQAGSTLTVVDSSGAELGSYEIPKAGQSVFFSSAEVTQGAQYTLEVNGSAAAQGTAGDYDENLMGGMGHDGGMDPGQGGPGQGELGGDMPDGFGGMGPGQGGPGQGGPGGQRPF